MPLRLRKLSALAAAGSPTSLLTLTVNPQKYSNPAAAANDLVRCWRLMRQRLTRDGYAHKSPFIAVVEATKRGWPHLHILCRLPYVPQAYLSRLARKFIDAPIVDIRKVYNAKHAARYIAKYVSKGPAQYAGCKRYWRSQDYAPSWDDHAPLADKNRRWFRERGDLSFIAANMQICDWHHSIDPRGDATMTPGPAARWLWWDHDPPLNVRRPTCKATT